jgi:hypothetical protein
MVLCYTLLYTWLNLTYAFILCTTSSTRTKHHPLHTSQLTHHTFHNNLLHPLPHTTHYTHQTALHKTPHTHYTHTTHLISTAHYTHYILHTTHYTYHRAACVSAQEILQRWMPSNQTRHTRPDVRRLVHRDQASGTCVV